MSATDENQFWQDFITGSRNAFRNLYDTYADMLFGYGCLYTPDRDLVKDCLHDLFVDLDRYRTGLNPNVNVKAYLLASFKRKLLAAKRKQPLFTPIESLEDQAAGGNMPDSESQLIGMGNEQAIMKRLHAELAKLPARQREVLHLKFNVGLSYVGISDVMEITEATCRTLAYRAIKRLRQRMENQPIMVFFIFLSSK